MNNYPPDILRKTVSYLCVNQISTLITCSKKFSIILCFSDAGKIFLRQCLLLNFDLQNESQLTLEYLKSLFKDAFGIYQNNVARFLGFKTSCGTDQFPNMWFGCPSLFIYPRNSTFSSQANHGKPVMVTGVYHSENISYFLQKHDVLNRTLQKELKSFKFQKNINIEERGRHSDQNYKLSKIRLLWFQYFRNLPFEPEDPIEDRIVVQLLNTHLIKIKNMLKDIVLQDCDIKSEKIILQTMINHFRQLRKSVQEFYLSLDLDLSGDFDQIKSELIRVKSQFDKYYELKHQIIQRDIFLIQSVILEQPKLPYLAYYRPG